MWCQCTTGGAQSRLGHLGHTAQRLRVAQVGAGLSRSLGALAAGEAQDLGWDVKGERIRPSPRAHPNPQAQAAHSPLALTSVYSGVDAPLGHRHSSTSSCPKCTSVLVVRRPRPVCSSQDSCTAAPVSLQGRSWASDGGLRGSGRLYSGPCLGLVPNMATGTGPLEAQSELVEVTGAEGPVLGSIKLSKKVGGEVRWSGRRGRCLKQGQGHAPQGHLQERVRAHGVRMGRVGRLA